MCSIDRWTAQDADDQVDAFIDSATRIKRGLGAWFASLAPPGRCAAVRLDKAVAVLQAGLLAAGVAYMAILTARAGRDRSAWTALGVLAIASTLLTIVRFRHVIRLASRVFFSTLGTMQRALLALTAVALAARAGLGGFREGSGLMRAALGVTTAVTAAKLVLVVIMLARQSSGGLGAAYYAADTLFDGPRLRRAADALFGDDDDRKKTADPGDWVAELSSAFA